MNWFSSDLHLNHNKDFIYKPRGFSSIYEMNETIIKNFNKVVAADDNLFLLGDIFLGFPEEGIKLFHQLPGNIYLIWGNHDTEHRKELMSFYYKATPLGYADILKYKKHHLYLSHFPSCTTNFDDYNRPLQQRTLCLAGHTHSKELFEPCGSYNVAVDAHNCYPVSIDTILEDFKNKYYNKEKE